MPDIIILLIITICGAIGIGTLTDSPGIRKTKTGVVLSIIAAVLFVWFLIADFQPTKYVKEQSFTIYTVNGTGTSSIQIINCDGDPISVTKLLGKIFPDNTVLIRRTKESTYCGVLFTMTSKNPYDYEIVYPK